MLEALIEIVRRAGDMVLSAHDIQNVTREKHGPADLVTQYDEAVQAFLRRELLNLLPERLLGQLLEARLVTPSSRVIMAAGDRLPRMRALLASSPHAPDLVEAMGTDWQQQMEQMND